ncbi:Fis family transcriptional regulator [Sphingobium lactosutens]|nr:Fis family transcriptional regulator [Sphingobium lactosutens]
MDGAGFRPICRALLRAGAAALMMVAGAAGAQQYYYEETTEVERGDDLMQDVVLGMQNEERESLGLAPLEWDAALAADANRYARSMARTGVFAHSNRASRSVPSGENLWMGTRGAFDYEAMIGSFLDEKRMMRRGGRMPDLSTTGRWQDVGHYSQIIWRSTRKVGCALGESAQYDYLVCRYYPAGNVFGQGPLDAEPSVLASGNGVMAHGTK